MIFKGLPDRVEREVLIVPNVSSKPPFCCCQLPYKRVYLLPRSSKHFYCPPSQTCMSTYAKEANSPSSFPAHYSLGSPASPGGTNKMTSNSLYLSKYPIFLR